MTYDTINDAVTMPGRGNAPCAKIFNLALFKSE
jgi:hypothetical protein